MDEQPGRYAVSIQCVFSSIMKMIALYLQSVTVVDNFTSTSTTISCRVMALWLQSVTQWTDKPLTEILLPK